MVYLAALKLIEREGDGKKEMAWPKIRPSGDSAVLVEFENRIDPEVNRSVRSLALAIESEALPGIKEVLPAYRALMVVYDPL
jgi:allophanate hydrolase subunit 1